MLNEAGSPSPAARREPPFPQSEMLRGHASAEIKIRCRMRGNLVRRDPVSGNSWRRCSRGGTKHAWIYIKVWYCTVCTHFFARPRDANASDDAYAAMSPEAPLLLAALAAAAAATAVSPAAAAAAADATDATTSALASRRRHGARSTWNVCCLAAEETAHGAGF